jgi:lipoprotein-anchoring transpeptidase ErfK/SrfK
VRLAQYEKRWTQIHVTVSLHLMQLSVWRGRHVIGRFPMADGSSATPTPTGRFVVTDRVDFPAGSVYGTFALGLSAHQLHQLPAGWPGGNQIAIHGTNDPGSIGSSASLGCVRVGAAALALLKRTVPLGAPVVVSP